MYPVAGTRKLRRRDERGYRAGYVAYWPVAQYGQGESKERFEGVEGGCDEHGRMLGDIAGMESVPVLRLVTEDANEEGDANVAMIVEGAGAGQPRPPSRKRRRVTQEEDLSRDTTRAVRSHVLIYPHTKN